MTEEQIKESAKASKGESTSAFRHHDQLEMKRLIQQAAEKPSSQEVHITGKVIRQPNLLAAIKEKGMDDGSIVWAQVATLLGIDVRRCHNYSQKLRQLLRLRRLLVPPRWMRPRPPRFSRRPRWRLQRLTRPR